MRIAAVLLVAVLGIAVEAPSVPDRRADLVVAKRAAATAAARAQVLTDAAGRERDAAKRVARDAQALAARVAAAEASLAAARTRVALVDQLLADRRAMLGERQAPVARLLAALGGLARRPAVAAIAQPGSVDDLVRVRAVLGAALPVVRARTQGLRDEIDRTRILRAAADSAAQALHENGVRLARDRIALAQLEAAHRSRARALGHDALSEADRALALGERARDLVDRMARDDDGFATTAELAALPGPIARPVLPGSAPRAHLGGAYRVPVAGRLVTGLDELSDTGVRSRGLTFVVAPAAPVRAPAGGVVRFARHFRDYGIVVIIDHGDGWTSAVIGLASTRVRPGDAVQPGTILGVAHYGREPQVTFELRRRGVPVDIAALIG